MVFRRHRHSPRSIRANKKRPAAATFLTPPTKLPPQGSRQGSLWRAEIRQSRACAKLTIFHVIGHVRPETPQNEPPKLRANQPLAAVPGVPEVTREYASTYQSLPG